MEIYLDNCSTTKPREEVIEEMVYVLRNEYGNPSSLHRLGFNIEKKVEEVRENIGKFLKVGKDEIYFTSGGTESNNLAIQGIINKYNRTGQHIITTKVEHPSVLNIIKYQEQKGFDITYLKVDDNGIISLDELRESIREDTILVSVMQVNNEIGSIQPICEIKNILREEGSNALVHVDGIQGFGKIPIDLKGYGVGVSKVYNDLNLVYLASKEAIGKRKDNYFIRLNNSNCIREEKATKVCEIDNIIQLIGTARLEMACKYFAILV